MQLVFLRRALFWYHLDSQFFNLFTLLRSPCCPINLLVDCGLYLSTQSVLSTRLDAAICTSLTTGVTKDFFIVGTSFDLTADTDLFCIAVSVVNRILLIVRLLATTPES